VHLFTMTLSSPRMDCSVGIMNGGAVPHIVRVRSVVINFAQGQFYIFTSTFYDLYTNILASLVIVMNL
jgi:hypothetical protein